MTPNRCLSLVLAGLLGFACGAQARRDDLEERVSALARPLVERAWVNGLAIAVIEHGHTHIVGLGRAGRGDAPPDGRTLFELGSLTKVFTGLALADLVVRETVTLEDPAQSMLPEGASMPPVNGRAITFLDLVTHTSGLPRLPTNFAPRDPADPYADYTRELLYAFLKSYKLEVPPGQRYEYSNLGAGLLGHLLAVADRASFDELIQRHICRMLGMEDVRVTLTHADQARRAEGHNPDGRTEPPWNALVLEGCVALHGTIHDMALFVQANLTPEAWEIGPALKLAQERRRPAWPGMSIGLGWHIEDDTGVRWHNGETFGFHNYMAIDVAHGVGVVVLSNTRCAAIDDLGRRLVKLARGEDVAALEVPATTSLPAADLADCAGSYSFAADVPAAIAVEGDHLTFSVKGSSPPVNLYPIARDRYFLKMLAGSVRFERDAGGHVVRLVFHHGNEDEVATRSR